VPAGLEHGHERKLHGPAAATLKARGMQVNEVAPEAVAQMRQQLKPVTDKFTKEIGETLISQVNAEIEKARAAQK
jgi:TRAP-type transport system periplasmic protein